MCTQNKFNKTQLPDADDAAITLDQFDWYSYQDRALGFQVDLNSGSICSGKILLGSHMKKPLWVDHSATTVSSLFLIYDYDYDALVLHCLFTHKGFEIRPTSSSVYSIPFLLYRLF